MRTPNCKCVVCGKPLYRRPNELRRVRHVACFQHRNEAQMRSGITEAQYGGLALGRPKGTNNRIGYTHKATSKRKASQANRTYWRAHPDLAIARGAKTRDELHYNWKGGSSKLNKSIRQMHEHRKWMDAIKARDGQCTQCGSLTQLESHHIVELAVLIARHGVKNRVDARQCAALWDLDNGQTLCEQCHYAAHGRRYEDRRSDVQAHAPIFASALCESTKP